MGTVRPHPPVKLICGILICPDQDAVSVHSAIGDAWGPMDGQTEWFAFEHTRYYETEMGTGLQKRYVSFENLVPVDGMTEIKHRSNQLESAFLQDGGRRVNIDPGYLADAKLLMMTTKNLAHRVYVGGNLFVDLQMIYKEDSYMPMPWAFADIRQPQILHFFNQTRLRYRDQLRAASFQGGFDS